MKINKKILFISGPSCGGAERMTILYAKILQKAGYECEIVTQIKPGEEQHATILNFIPKKIKHQEAICRFRYYAFHLYKIIKTGNPDIIFCSMPLVARILAIFKITHLCRAKLIFRCFNTPSKASKTLSEVLKHWFKYADIVISQTKEMTDELVSIYKLPKDKVVTIYNPIDKDLIHEKIKDTFVYDPSYTNYLGVGSLSSRKNFCNLVEAFAIVQRKKQTSRLYIIGDGNDKKEKEKIVKIIHDKGIESNVFLEGFQTNPFKYIKGCDCFVLSSDFEGLPNVMLEAMYLGRPVAATVCIPYIKQVVHNGENGYTCPIRDPESLAKAMLKASEIKKLPVFNDVNHSDEQVINLFNTVAQGII